MRLKRKSNHDILNRLFVEWNRMKSNGIREKSISCDSCLQ